MFFSLKKEEDEKITKWRTRLTTKFFYKKEETIHPKNTHKLYLFQLTNK